eukprot:4662583-Prymnesium_polylepis.1
MAVMVDAVHRELVALLPLELEQLIAPRAIGRKRPAMIVQRDHVQHPSPPARLAAGMPPGRRTTGATAEGAAR